MGISKFFRVVILIVFAFVFDSAYAGHEKPCCGCGPCNSKCTCGCGCGDVGEIVGQNVPVKGTKVSGKLCFQGIDRFNLAHFRPEGDKSEEHDLLFPIGSEHNFYEVDQRKDESDHENGRKIGLKFKKGQCGFLNLAKQFVCDKFEVVEPTQ